MNGPEENNYFEAGLVRRLVRTLSVKQLMESEIHLSPLLGDIWQIMDFGQKLIFIQELTDEEVRKFLEYIIISDSEFESFIKKAYPVSWKRVLESIRGWES